MAFFGPMLLSYIPPPLFLLLLYFIYTLSSLINKKVINKRIKIRASESYGGALKNRSNARLSESPANSGFRNALVNALTEIAS